MGRILSNDIVQQIVVYMLLPLLFVLLFYAFIFPAIAFVFRIREVDAKV